MTRNETSQAEVKQFELFAQDDEPEPAGKQSELSAPELELVAEAVPEEVIAALRGSPQSQELDSQDNILLATSPTQSTDLRSPYDRVLIAQARELFLRGASYKTVAFSLKVPVYTAREWMHRHRNGTLEALVTGERAVGRFSDKARQEVIRLRTELGMSYNNIVKATGISRTTVRSWLADIHKDDCAPEQVPFEETEAALKS